MTKTRQVQQACVQNQVIEIDCDNAVRESEPPSCSICFELPKIKGNLSCGHDYCFECILEWSKIETTCPLCKSRFTSIEKVEPEEKKGCGKRKKKETKKSVKVPRTNQRSNYDEVSPFFFIHELTWPINISITSESYQLGRNLWTEPGSGESIMQTRIRGQHREFSSSFETYFENVSPIEMTRGRRSRTTATAPSNNNEVIDLVEQEINESQSNPSNVIIPLNPPILEVQESDSEDEIITINQGNSGFAMYINCPNFEGNFSVGRNMDRPQSRIQRVRRIRSRSNHRTSTRISNSGGQASSRS